MIYVRSDVQEDQSGRPVAVGAIHFSTPDANVVTENLTTPAESSPLNALGGYLEVIATGCIPVSGLVVSYLLSVTWKRVADVLEVSLVDVLHPTAVPVGGATLDVVANVDALAIEVTPGSASPIVWDVNYELYQTPFEYDPA